MKALMIEGPGRIVCESVPDPVLHDGRSAIVRITSCGLCGSDLHPYHVATGREPFCIGHEAVGEIVETGGDVHDFRTGDRVLVSASVGCGVCAACIQGNTVLCHNARTARVFGQGQPDLGGCQAEFVAVPTADNNLWRLPSDVSDEVGLLLSDNLATAWYCARRARVVQGDVVAVIGLGPVGLQCVMAAQAQGAARVLAIDLVESRRIEAATLGAEPVDPADPAGAVKAMTDGHGVDVVLDAAGGAATTALSVRIARRGGRISVVGVTEQPLIDFPALEMIGKSLEYHAGICSVQAELPALFAALQSGRLKADALGGLVSHRLPLSEGSAGYALFDRRDPNVGKIVFDPTL